MIQVVVMGGSMLNRATSWPDLEVWEKRTTCVTPPISHVFLEAQRTGGYDKCGLI